MLADSDDLNKEELNFYPNSITPSETSSLIPNKELTLVVKTVFPSLNR